MQGKLYTADEIRRAMKLASVNINTGLNGALELCKNDPDCTEQDLELCKWANGEIITQVKRYEQALSIILGLSEVEHE